ncbi:hypothetical protein KM043_014552 [Ampulex compressa]|nr:hypothetical protein KM043_014552 [Ampulex compressa]
MRYFRTDTPRGYAITLQIDVTSLISSVGHWEVTRLSGMEGSKRKKKNAKEFPRRIGVEYRDDRPGMRDRFANGRNELRLSRPAEKLLLDQTEKLTRPTLAGVMSSGGYAP